jgi:hypothetical protein
MARDGSSHGGGRNDPEPRSNESRRLADIANSKHLEAERDRLAAEREKSSDAST